MMEIDHYDQEDIHNPPQPTTEMEDPYAAAHTVYDDEMNLDEMPVTQEDAWAVIRLVFVNLWEGDVCVFRVNALVGVVYAVAGLLLSFFSVLKYAHELM